MKRVLLTGGAGGVGVHVLAHIMHNTDWFVTLIDSFHHKGYKDRITRVCRDHPDWLPRIKELQHDLTCPISPELKKEIGPVNYILHLAALSDVQFSVENPVWVIKNNVDSTLVMLEYARHTEHDVFWYFSTDEVYGPVKKGEAHPEWATMYPSNAYSASKGAGELFAYTYWRNGWAKLIISNTMNNFSEFQSTSKFPAMVQRALMLDEEITIHGNKEEIGSRFYIHSRNVGDAMLHILSLGPPTEHKTGEIDRPDRYHIVGEVCLDNLELAKSIAKMMGKKLKYKMVDFHKDNPAHDIHYGLQDNKVRASGWEQPLSYAESMKNTIDWQTRNPEWLQ